ncbi:hypothetical protein, partial [Escherichia coli]|uniref:hypothetical protein n=1 Tax=Escherichia coli TaxID=562 RepID=UPI00063D1985
AVVGKVVVAGNSNHAVEKVAQNLQARNLRKNRLAASAMSKPSRHNNVAGVRKNRERDEKNAPVGLCLASGKPDKRKTA